MKKITLVLFLILLGNVYFASSQSIVVTTPQERNVVLEEFTGIHCQYCPEGHTIAQALQDAHPGRVVLVNVHQGGYATPSGSEPDFRTAFGDALATNASVSGYPSGTVNRHLYPNIEATMALGRGSWNAAANEVFAQQSPVNVGFNSSYNSGTGELTVNVELYYTQNSPAADNFIQVAFLENHLIGFQQLTTGTNSAYDHKHVLRHFITGQWGDIVSTTTQGTLVQRTYVYTVPATYINTNCTISNCDVAVYVSENHNEVYTGGVAAVGSSFNGGMSLYTGNFNHPAGEFLQGTQGNVSTFTFSSYSSLTGTEDFTYTLTTDAPGDWAGNFTVDGTTYTTTATVPVANATPANITVNVTPGATAAVAKYTLTMTSVNNPGANPHIIELYVISGITDLVVNGSGSWGDGGSYNWQSVYTDGLTFAGNTSFAAVNANVMLKAANGNALGGVGHMYLNIGWTFPSFQDDEATALMNFMNNGGNVMVCGQDIGWDIKSGSGYGTTITSNLYTNYMHATYNADGGTGNNSLNPVATDLIFGGTGTSPIIDVYNGNLYPDQITPITGAVSTFKYGTSANNGGIRYTNGTYKMVYIAPGMEHLSNITTKNNILKQTHDWFHGLLSAESAKANPSDIIIYPNPASDKLYIDAFTYNPSDLSVQIADITGKTVLESGTLSQNQSINISSLESGFYFVKISGKNSQEVRKIEIIK